MDRTLLAVYAHPDDEAFGTGGTLAYYAEQGVQVALVCATRGEAGEIADPELATPETLGSVRENELRCAAEKIGVRDVAFLDYRDSGMEGTPENQAEDALIQAPEDEVVAQLVAIIRRIKPDVVVTFEPNGGYGHPDHIAIHKHTVAAFHAAGVASRFPEHGQPWQPKRLFFTAIPRSFFVEMREHMTALGMDTSDFDRFEEGGAGWPDEQVDVVLDITDWIEKKWSALYCHRTQFGPDNLFRRIPEEIGKKLMSQEHFALAWPETETDSRLTGLFDGLEA